MLYEDDVVTVVSLFLEAEGWSIVRRAFAHEPGDDVVASKDGVTLRVEAKGEGSSKAGTARYGQVFNAGQVKDHVAVAVLRALGWWSAGGTAQRPALAFPDNLHHRRYVGSAAEALHHLDAGIFWVRSDKTVTLEAPWSP